MNRNYRYGSQREMDARAKARDALRSSFTAAAQENGYMFAGIKRNPKDGDTFFFRNLMSDSISAIKVDMNGNLVKKPEQAMKKIYTEAIRRFREEPKS